MKFITKIIILMLFVTTFNSTAQERTKIDGVAAVVGNNIVLYSEVKAAKLQVDQASETKDKISECAILEKIMNDKLLAHHAVIDSLVVDEASINGEVDRKIAYFTKQLGSKEKLTEFFGFNTISEIKKELFNVEKEGMLIKRNQYNITQGVDVTPEEVTNYFESLKAENNIPEFGAEIELAQIVLEAKPDDSDKKEILEKLLKMKAEIEAGSSFKMKAILYSQDPSATRKGSGYGGLYEGITKETQFVKEFKEAAFSLEEGEVSEPFKTQFGYHILTVENIKGKERDIRHILMQVNITDEALDVVKEKLVSIRDSILIKKINFEDAVRRYSTDKATNKNGGVLINLQTNDTHFDLTNIDPSIYARISELKEGELSDIFYDETREGKKMFKVLLIKNKIDAHKADLDKDYVKIKSLALQKKKKELVEKWTREKIKDTYIKVHSEYKDCDFEYDWNKKTL
ncbi:MAG: peptidylprolyl isomerase [Flavobacteriaceae bacterium]